MKKYNYNFSIITSGGCSSACSFCTDPFNVKSSDDYIENMTKIIMSKDYLPTYFDQVSVTGGEPTQSKDFEKICHLLLSDKLRPHRQFNKRVLTTNGWKLSQHIDIVGKTFDHVNISRHGIGDEDNFNIFKGKNIALDTDILYCCSKLSQYGVDVNLNHVYKDKLSQEYIQEYIKYAKSLNATKITFRYDQNTNQMLMSDTELEVSSVYKTIEQGGCPVCREACYLIDGMYVTFKNSCAEPTHELKGELYEIIYHVDGKLYKDWSKKYPYSLMSERELAIVSKIEQQLVTRYVGSGGCGRGGWGSGGC